MTTDYPIIDVTGWVVDRVEQMGSKTKVWLFDPSDRRWLFKQNRPGTGEDWSEKLGAEFAEALGLPHAAVELASLCGASGVISLDFISNRRTAQLVHGNELIVELIDAKYPAKGKKYGVSQHTVSRVLDVLDRPLIQLPSGVTLPPAISRPPELFVGYLLLDALIGNTDRHHENWGVIDLRPTPAAPLRAELAPTFDHASCLGRELTDDRRSEALTTRDKNRTVNRYVEKMRSAFYKDAADASPLHPLQAFRLAAERFPTVTIAWFNRLNGITSDDMRSVIARVPLARMSDASRGFCIEVLELTKKSLAASPGVVSP